MSVAPVAAQEPLPQAEVVISGKGYGHGVGMAQDGAYAMGLAGATTAEIFTTFYPGAAITKRAGSTVRVDVLDGPRPSVVIALPGGGRVAAEDSAGFPVTLSPGGRVRVSFDGRRMRVSPLAGASVSAVAPAPVVEEEAEPAPTPTTSTSIPTLLGLIPLPLLPPPTTAPPPTTTPPPPPEPPAEPTSERSLSITTAGGSLIELPELGRRYRGTMEARGGGGGLQLVNALDLEQYLRGMGEVLSPGWPAAALRAQAIAARTYAVSAMLTGGGLCSTQQCQVYLGQQVEYGAMDKAVADTAGQVLTHRGGLVQAVYSANGGGMTATPEEGFGVTGVDYPYLKAAPYPTTDPQPWDVRLRLADLAARLGYRGKPAQVEVTKAGPSGRALEVTVTGDAGPLIADGVRVWNTLGLRSNFFTMRMEAPVEVVAGEQTPALVLAPGRRPPAQVLEAGTDAPPWGRAPWVALALLLVVWWSTAATRARVARGRRNQPPPRGPTEVSG